MTYQATETERRFYTNYIQGKPPILERGYGLTYELNQQNLVRLIGSYHLSPCQNLGKHNCYVTVLDADGNRTREVNLLHGYGSNVYPVILEKPDNEPQGNFPLYSNVDNYWLKPEGGDKVSGISSRHADEFSGCHEGNTFGHHSFHFVYVVDEPEPPIEPPTEPIYDQPLWLDDIIVEIDGKRYGLRELN